MIRKILSLLLACVLLSGCVVSMPDADAPAPGCDVNLAGSAADLTEEQNTVARAIITVAMAVGAGREGAVVGIVTSVQESGLKSVNYGDIMVNGQMSSSRGPFQQLKDWGPLADRLDPMKSAQMFFNGGAAGQAGLLDISGWRTMSPDVAAQAVQRSRNGSLYKPHVALAGRVVDEFMGTATASKTCGSGSVIANGVSVTIPDNQFVAEAVRGKSISTPNAGTAKGIAAGLSELGKPYIWGGNNDDGCIRGGGQLNSCQGLGPGWDCSGLTEYVLKQGGFGSPGGNSSAQRAGGVDIPWSNGLPSDIVGFSGHVAVYLGIIEGSPYILEASTPGVPVHVVKLTRSDHDPVFHRYWDGSNA